MRKTVSTALPNIERYLSTMTFEATLKRLEQILSSLEEEQVGLDTSLKLFEEGVKLLREASTELEAAETKVHLLVERANGEFQLRETDL